MENITPEQAGSEGWNTDEALIGSITSEQAARMLSAFVAAFRILYAAKRAGGDAALIKQAYSLIAHQMALANDPDFVEKHKETADSANKLGIIAIGQAMVAVAAEDTDPRSISSLTENALGAVETLIKNHGADAIKGNHFLFNVKKGSEENVFISAFLKSKEEIAEAVDTVSATNQAKSKIIKLGGLKKGGNGKA